MSLGTWRDRLGREHLERSPDAHERRGVSRVLGELEERWADVAARPVLAEEALSRPNPQVAPDPEHPGEGLWTWVVQEPQARVVALFLNPVFDHTDVAATEFARLPDSDLWAITLRLPLDLRAGYRVAVWNGDDEPPWRSEAGRREITLALKDTSAVDPRGSETMAGSHGDRWSIGAGPAAPVEPWRGCPVAAGEPRVADLDLPGGENAWVYEPPTSAGETPLLVLFDGQGWRQLGLPELLDRAISAGKIAPLHVALLDSGDLDYRWAHLGVPGRQVDTVIDELLPRVRSGWHVSGEGADTWVSGQSLGGIASLWTLALAGGQVGRAIAQSPSLWRFDIADALLAEPGWQSILMQSGTYEADMLRDALALQSELREKDRRPVEVTPAVGGHDWAVWRAGLLRALAGLKVSADSGSLVS